MAKKGSWVGEIPYINCQGLLKQTRCSETAARLGVGCDITHDKISRIELQVLTDLTFESMSRGAQSFMSGYYTLFNKVCISKAPRKISFITMLAF